MLEMLTDPPVQPLDTAFFSRYGISVHIKREDLAHPFLSGNKWRKLKYILEDAGKNGKTRLVSFGGAYSNHLVALACAGATYGFATSAFVRGEPVENHMIRLCRTWGMELRFTGREAYRDKMTLFAEQYADDPSAYFIDEGGKGPLAAKGCAEMLYHVTGFTHVIVPVGTGTTLAGVATAARSAGMVAEGICVLKGAEYLAQEVASLAGHEVTIHHDFHRGGYAKADDALMNFIASFAQETGLLLDQVYTAKMMMAVMELAARGYYRQRDRLLLVHTGGLLGLLS